MRWGSLIKANDARFDRGITPNLQPFLLGNTYLVYHSLNRAELTDEQIRSIILPAMQAMVGRHRLRKEFVVAAVRDHIWPHPWIKNSFTKENQPNT